MISVGDFLADIENSASKDGDLAQTLPIRGHPELTLRDEANAITAHAFRNGFLEELHAGRPSPILADPGVSRITDDEMKKLMIEASARLAHWLYLRELLLDERPDIYCQLVTTTRWMFARSWERRARTCSVAKPDAGVVSVCPSCQVALLDGWRFCPLCGAAAAGTVVEGR
ncbi:MAG: zinc ribbon domain-containing protein [Deltaproteobacteria bacterium]|nr:zinc ribbon domain-containing protein [Deltaproteobacteria bacterium]